uniref:Uncharacterized protein n=1 Tax=Cacopsylla melanoneura TaxID=428564 RepID=A0A8D8T299_9HEMI
MYLYQIFSIVQTVCIPTKPLTSYCMYTKIVEVSQKLSKAQKIVGTYKPYSCNGSKIVKVSIKAAQTNFRLIFCDVYDTVVSCLIRTFQASRAAIQNGSV